MSSLRFFVNERFVLLFLFGTYLAVSLGVMRDFGSGWDENDNRRFGQMSRATAEKFFQTGDGATPQVAASEHGTAFVTATSIAEGLFGHDYDQDPAAAQMFVHRAVFLTFFLSAFVFYLLCKNYFSDWRIAALGVVFLITHPRIFHHSFHNAQDIPFLSACILAYYTQFKLLDNPSIRWALIHALATAFAIDIRIAGIMVPPLTLFLLLIKKRGAPPQDKRVPISVMSIYLIGTAGFTIAFWPFLWAAPISNFAWALKSMSKILFTQRNLYFGQFIPGTPLPWHYNPIWIVITTPTLVILLAATGIGRTLASVIKRPVIFARENPKAIAVTSWLFLPLIAPIVLRSTLFDEWRHHYFVYPALVVFTLIGFHFLLMKFPLKTNRLMNGAIIVLVVLLMGVTGRALIKLHPYQHLYFSFGGRILAGEQEGINHKFEMDYWGLSFKEGLEFLSQFDQGKIVIYWPHDDYSGPILGNRVWLKKADRERISISNDWLQSNYFLGNYRYILGEYPPELGQEIFSRYVGKTKILTVRKLPARRRG